MIKMKLSSCISLCNLSLYIFLQIETLHIKKENVDSYNKLYDLVESERNKSK